MPDREKVIKGLEGVYRCISPANHTCGDCPYQDNHVECIRRALSDAIALLKEQEQTINKLEEKLRLLEHGDHNDEVLQVNSWEDEYYGTVALCPKCECKWMMGNGDDLNFCPKCGQAVKWNG